MFGNNGREMVISLPKQTKYKKHQMSLSLHVLKKQIVVVGILSSFCADCWCFLRGFLPVFGAKSPVAFTP